MHALCNAPQYGISVYKINPIHLYAKKSTQSAEIAPHRLSTQPIPRYKSGRFVVILLPDFWLAYRPIQKISLFESLIFGKLEGCMADIARIPSHLRRFNVEVFRRGFSKGLELRAHPWCPLIV